MAVSLRGTLTTNSSINSTIAAIIQRRFLSLSFEFHKRILIIIIIIIPILSAETISRHWANTKFPFTLH